jgi:hypothetical protein
LENFDNQNRFESLRSEDGNNGDTNALADKLLERNEDSSSSTSKFMDATQMSNEDLEKITSHRELTS